MMQTTKKLDCENTLLPSTNWMSDDKFLALFEGCHMG